MIARAESDKSIGVVGPISNKVSGVQIVKETNYESIDEMREFAEKISRENKGKFFEFPRVAFLCALIKREVIEKIGGLDERFSPGNYEDDDYCLRAQLAGFKTVVALDVFVHHYGSKSFTAEGEEKYQRLLQKNKKKFIEKWGATPDEIWLRNKTPRMQELFIPLNDAFNISDAVVLANRQITKGNYKAAYANLMKAIWMFENKNINSTEQDVKQYDVLNLAGKVALYLEKLDDAKKMFTKELKMGKSNSRAYESLGDLFVKANDEGNALKCYTVAQSFGGDGILERKIERLEKRSGLIIKK
ncbi:MAG: glycosyltransferase family 2 protein [Chlorobi bacterium]|nr:glycosyltransferase family 2 protein [Chlorobiota bacterium]